VYAACIIVNGLWFHLTGRTLRIGRICESIQTERGMRVAMARAGFSRVAFRRTAHFIVTAER
jgi:hypothetical protein